MIAEPLKKEARLDRAIAGLIAYFQADHKCSYEQAVCAANVIIGCLPVLETPAVLTCLETAAAIAKEECA